MTMQHEDCKKSEHTCSGPYWKKKKKKTRQAYLTLGDTLGLALGEPDGDTLGLELGLPLGETDGETDGETEGLELGLPEGLTLGDELGDPDGDVLGDALGETEGDTDGLIEPGALIGIVPGRVSTATAFSAAGPDSRRSVTNASLVSAARSWPVMWAITFSSFSAWPTAAAAFMTLAAVVVTS